MQTQKSPRVIAFYAPAAQSGKTTSAMYLRETGYMLAKFAAPVKTMVDILLQWAGIPGNGESHQYIDGPKKLEPIAILGGKTSRELQQTLGTEWGREMVSPTIWADLLVFNLKAHMEANEAVRFVIDDLRFPEEIKALEDAFGDDLLTIHLSRPEGQVEASNGHKSEGLLGEHPFDVYIVNDGSIEDLYKKLDAAVS